MSIWTKNILEFKLVRILMVLGIITLTVIYIVDYNSLERRCGRKIRRLFSSMPKYMPELMKNTSSSAVDAVKKQGIEECVKNKEI